MVLEKRQRFREENRAKRSYQYFDDHSMSRRLIQVPFYKLTGTLTSIQEVGVFGWEFCLDGSEEFVEVYCPL